MKTSKLIPFSVLFLVTMLACSTISNLAAQPTPTPDVVLFEETEFVDACKSESTSDVERFVENGQFIMKVVTPSYIGWTECTGTEYADFIVEADATQLSGPDNNAYGIILRYGLQSDEFYAFLISGDGYHAFTVDGVNHSDPEFLADWTESSAINKGTQTNRLGSRVRWERIGLERAEKARKTFFRYRGKNDSFTDCTSFVVMRELKLHEAFTTDHHFAQMGFTLKP